MITIKPTALKDFATLLQMDVKPEQKGFITPFESLYQKRRQGEVFYTVHSDDKPIGYLSVDKTFSYSLTFAKRHELGIKAIVLGAEFQRQGFGRKAIRKLLMQVYNIMPDCESVCVTIPRKNQGAKLFFLASGFKDTERFYQNDNGAEFILRCSLS